MTTTLFDLTAPLPSGTTVLEASAGTGKTFAIAALAARYIAEGGVTIDDLLLITFSRAATAELRTRVRERLRMTAEALGAAARGVRPTDAVAAHLAAGTPTEVAERAARLEDAFSRFDRAAIMTTHEFCHGMLAGLGILAPQTPQSTLVEDLRPLADEVAEDVYLRLFADAPHGAPFPFGKVWDADPGAQDIARHAVGELADLVGAGTPGAAGVRVEFAEAVRHEVARRKEERRLFSFDDQLTRLADALADPTTGPQARARLAARFPVVLVDEFQDTDPTQWSVLRSAFGSESTLVLIGDPKQAIYGFRGGDVHTYAAAVTQADATTTLGVNHRSDPEVVEGVGRLFTGVALGDGIIAPPVSHSQPSRLVGAPGTGWERGIQVRALESDSAVRPSNARRAITADLVAVVGTLVGDDAPLRGTDAPLRRSDIAVLVRTNARGQEVATALASAGVPATFNGTNSVLATQAAEDWITLLRALDQPRRPFLQRALLTDFIGATLPDLARADEQQHTRWSVQIHTWARVLARSGVPALFAALDADNDLVARLLSRPDGERLVTDHRHLAELLHQHHARTGSGRAADLAAWLVAERDGGAADTTQRRDTDADAVQVLTIHRAKGLQWPVVLLPEVSHQREATADTGRLLVLPAGNTRILDVAGRQSPARQDRWRRWQQEDADEALRALYVGLTRAQSRVVTWWAHHWDVAASPLHRLLHATHDATQPARPALAYPTDDLPGGGSPTHLGWLAGSQVVAVRAGEAATPASGPATSGTPELATQPWLRTIDHVWRRTSYSGLTAAAHASAAPGDAALVSDEGLDEVSVPADPSWSVPSPMADLPAGAAFGTLVHAVYEHTDATGDDWRADLREAVEAALRRWPIAQVGADALATALVPSFTTPLGPLAPGRTLRSFGPADHLAEMDFEFALDHPDATLTDIAALLAEHLGADDPLADYPSRLDHPGLGDQTLRGFLTGSIDSVLRLREGEATEGFLVVDYKTNRLSAPEEDLTLGHYTPAAMAEAMMASHYPLQALLYCVALHRFLRLRMADYDPEQHLAGVLYLFVRGMAGEQTPLVAGQPLGVFAWKPPAALVVAVSRLLAGGAA
ncbi:MAG: UvrD-helicase domain-containing protein [Propionibacteriaceae bacterium]|nr:UvrD-helicase domain-containing protein [Propionibacteriaceae bacterium]